jgi:hypothetical protein
MTNHYVKYENFVMDSFQDNQRKPCGLPTDRPTLAKQYTPSSSKGGIINLVETDQNLKDVRNIQKLHTKYKKVVPGIGNYLLFFF